MSTLWFPDLPGITVGTTRAPDWSGLLKQTAASGLEVRQQQWSAPQWEWTLIFNYLRGYKPSPGGSAYQEWQTLMGFINQQYGGLLSFFYRDPDDNQTTLEPIGTGDGATTAFQLKRALGGAVEPIYGVDTRGSATYGPYTRPAALTPVALVSGSPVSATFNGDTGVVTYASAPASSAPLTATFSYGFRVRFEEDKIEFIRTWQQLYEAKQVKLLQSRT